MSHLRDSLSATWAPWHALEEKTDSTGHPTSLHFGNSRRQRMRTNAENVTWRLFRGPTLRQHGPWEATMRAN